MKKLKNLICIATILILGCEGPPGYDGLPGRDGQDGIDGTNGEESFVFEYEFDFTGPDYEVLLNLPDNFTMLDSDVMLVYLLWKVEDNLEVWRAVPQTLYLAEGILHYNYDFTKFDAKIFLDGTVDLDALGSAYTDAFVARVVVVPGQFTDGRMAIDYSDYNQVKAYFNLSPSKLATDDYTSRPE